MTTLPTIHVLYENPAWLPPLLEGLEAEGFLDVRLVKPNEGLVDSVEPPPEGIWINALLLQTEHAHHRLSQVASSWQRA